MRLRGVVHDKAEIGLRQLNRLVINLNNEGVCRDITNWQLKVDPRASLPALAFLLLLLYSHFIAFEQDVFQADNILGDSFPSTANILRYRSLLCLLLLLFFRLFICRKCCCNLRICIIWAVSWGLAGLVLALLGYRFHLGNAHAVHEFWLSILHVVVIVCADSCKILRSCLIDVVVGTSRGYSFRLHDRTMLLTSVLVLVLPDNFACIP